MRANLLRFHLLVRPYNFVDFRIATVPTPLRQQTQQGIGFGGSRNPFPWNEQTRVARIKNRSNRPLSFLKAACSSL